MPRRIFGPKKNEVAGGWRRLHEKGLQDSQKIIRVIKSRRKRRRWAENVARM
jgi:hypothetical protein